MGGDADSKELPTLLKVGSSLLIPKLGETQIPSSGGGGGGCCLTKRHLVRFWVELLNFSKNFSHSERVYHRYP